MTSLPRALARWEQELAWLPPTLVPALGAMLPRVAQAIGPLSRSKRETGEPDGYGRIARRGPFDRLLTSQWALLDEVPEDFLRRASSHELLFFELARSEPHGSERSIALFDAGPFSLGAPRIAHLAILVVLARRAADAGVPFFWSTVRERTPRPFVGEASVRQLLAAHTPFCATEESLAGWNEELRPALERRAREPREELDLFVVGDRATLVLARSQLVATLGAIVVEDAIDGSRERLTLSVTRAKQPTRTVALPLPDESTRVRLLRDPFRAPEARPLMPVRRPDAPAWHAHIGGAFADTAVAFSRDGRKVLARGASGGIVAIALPERDEAGRVLVRHFAGEPILAAGALGRRIVRIARGPNGTLQLFELHGGSRDLDQVELRGQRALGAPGELAALSVGVLSPAAAPLDLAVRTRMGLALWASTTAEPRVVAANAVVPNTSGAAGFAIARRADVLPRSGRFSFDGYLSFDGHATDSSAEIARAPDDTLVVLRTGDTSDGPVERAEALMRRPASPGFLGVLDVLRHDAGATTIVSEHSEAPRLDVLLARVRSRASRLPLASAVWLAHLITEVVRTLEDARHPPHGMLRPEAIHVTSDGRVRIEHVLGWPLDPSAPALPPQRIGYIAPEQARGLPVDVRTDVFSLGLILHELLGGVHATGIDAPMDRLVALQKGRLIDLAAVLPDLPPELHAIVRTATATDPDARFPTVHALNEALWRYRRAFELTAVEELLAPFALDEEPTTRRQLVTPWEIVTMRPSREGGVERVAPASRVVVGGTSGGQGLFGFVELDRVRIVAPGRVGEQVVPVPAGTDVVGVCALTECVVRRGDALEIRDRNGVLAAFPVSLSARVTMSPGWPNVAITTPGGTLRVISLSQRREVLVAGASA